MLPDESRKEIEEIISFLRPLELTYDNEYSTIQYVIDKVKSFIKRFDVPQPYKKSLEDYINASWIPEEEAIKNGFLVAENLDEFLKFKTKEESEENSVGDVSDNIDCKILFSVLHFSDLHFGEYSALTDEKRKGDFSNMFSNLRFKINSILNKNKINLVVISGDISSKTKLFVEEKIESYQEIPEYLHKFINIFTPKKIPILLAKGNHERKREDFHSLDIYKRIFNLVKNDLNIKLSRDFEKNLISYYIEPNHKFLFFTVDTTFSLSSAGNWKDANIDISIIDDLFEELKEEPNLEDYSICLITHHPLRKIPNNKSILAGLAERNIKTVFSGHVHEKDFQRINIPDSQYIIDNIIAGSPSLSKQRRDEENDWNLKSLQFNYYEVCRNSIQAYYYELDSNNFWKKRILHKEPNFSRKHIPIQSKIKEEKAEKFLKLVKLFDRLFYKRGKTASSFTQGILDDSELRDYFGISVENPQSTNLSNENVYFLDGDYYIIPNSVTLCRIDVNRIRQLITKNNADDENIKKVVGGFLRTILDSIGIENPEFDFKGRILDFDDFKL